MAKATAGKAWAYDAHPAAGLRSSGRREPHAPLPTQLGLGWLRLPRSEQARRRRAFVAALLEPWVARGGVTFAAAGVLAGPAASLAALDGVREDRAGLAGPLTAETAELLLDGAPARIELRGDGRSLLDAREGWTRIQVLLDDEEAAAARERIRALRQRWRADALEDRRGRGIALLALHYALLAVAIAVALAVARLLDGALSPLVVYPVALAAGFVFFSSLEPLLQRALRWYGEG